MERVEVLVRKLAAERDALAKRVAELEIENKSIKKEIERVSDDLHDAEDRASDAEKRCTAEWEKDCAAALRSLAEETNFQWDPDGDPADTVREHIQLTLEEYDSAVYQLRAEVARFRDTLSIAHEGAARQLAEPRNHDNDQYALTAIATACEIALASSPGNALWLKERDEQMKRLGAAEWLEKQAELGPQGLLAEASRLRAGKGE